MYLSVIMASRNDNHGGDLNERTQNCIDSLSEQIKRFKIDAEIVIVDWNPPAGKPFLYEVIKGKYRSIIVPPKIHNRYGQAKLFPLYQMIAKNVGIRRAKGDFVLATNIDILFDDTLMEFLSRRLLDKGNIYRAYRYDSKPGMKTVADAKKNLIRLNLSYADELCTNACGDFQLMHRDDWADVHGYFEKDLFSIHIDSLLEYIAVCHGIKEMVLRPPKVTYHVDHTGGWVPGIEKSKGYNRMNDEKIKKLSYPEFLDIVAIMQRQTTPFHYNKEDWGLINDRLEEVNIV